MFYILYLQSYIQAQKQEKYKNVILLAWLAFAVAFWLTS